MQPSMIWIATAHHTFESDSIDPIIVAGDTIEAARQALEQAIAEFDDDPQMWLREEPYEIPLHTETK